MTKSFFSGIIIKTSAQRAGLVCFSRGEIMTRDEIKKLFQQHSYIMRTAELSAARIYYADIQRLLDEGVIDKVKRGYYYLVDEQDYSEISILKRLLPEAILCMDTALFYYGYSDRTPLMWHLAVDKDMSKSKTKIDYPFIKAYYFEPNTLQLGVTEGEIDGRTVSIYDRDRTICDCLRYIGRMDREIFNKAIQGYVTDPKKNVPNLTRYAKVLRVQQKVKDLIGVWM